MSLINLEISNMVYMKGKRKIGFLSSILSDSELHVVVVNVVDLVSWLFQFGGCRNKFNFAAVSGEFSEKISSFVDRLSFYNYVPYTTSLYGTILGSLFSMLLMVRKNICFLYEIWWSHIHIHQLHFSYFSLHHAV